jgi:hypothetical protein
MLRKAGSVVITTEMSRLEAWCDLRCNGTKAGTTTSMSEKQKSPHNSHAKSVTKVTLV